MIKRYLSVFLFTTMLAVVYGQQKTNSSNLVLEPLTIEMNTTVLSNSVNNGFNVLRESSFGIEGPHLNYPLSFAKENLSYQSRRGGSLTINDNGTPFDLFDDLVVYTPPKDFVGIDIVNYQIKTKSGVVKNGLITIDVKKNPASKKTQLQKNRKSSRLSFTIFPNPSNGTIKTTFNSSTMEVAKVYLIDLSGKIIYQSEVNLIQGKNNLDFNFNVSQGVMFLKIIGNSNYGIQKVIFE